MEPVFQTNVISVGQRTYMIGSQFLTQRYKNRTLFVFLCDEINTIFFVGSRVILWSNSYNNENCEKKIYNLYDLCQQWISQQPENGENRNDPDLVQAFLKKWWVESDFKAPNLPLSLRLSLSKPKICSYCSPVLTIITNKYKMALISNFSLLLFMWHVSKIFLKHF
jgi:hypothetical protein